MCHFGGNAYRFHSNYIYKRFVLYKEIIIVYFVFLLICDIASMRINTNAICSYFFSVSVYYSATTTVVHHYRRHQQHHHYLTRHVTGNGVKNDHTAVKVTQLRVVGTTKIINITDYKELCPLSTQHKKGYDRGHTFTAVGSFLTPFPATAYNVFLNTETLSMR